MTFIHHDQTFEISALYWRGGGVSVSFGFWTIGLLDYSSDYRGVGFALDKVATKTWELSAFLSYNLTWDGPEFVFQSLRSKGF